MERARKLGITGRSRLTKMELGQAVAKRERFRSMRASESSKRFNARAM
jgi:hypothetical protein